jgi:hypothetical protein
MSEKITVLKDNLNYLQFSNSTFNIIIILLVSIILLILYNNYYCSKLKTVKIKGNLLDSLDKKVNFTNHPKELENGENTTPHSFEKKFSLINEINDFHKKQDEFIAIL